MMESATARLVHAARESAPAKFFLALIDADFLEVKFVVMLAFVFGWHSRAWWLTLTGLLLLAALTAATLAFIVNIIGYWEGGKAVRELTKTIALRRSRFRRIEVVSDDELQLFFNYSHSDFPFRDKDAPILVTVYDFDAEVRSFRVQCFFNIWETSYVILNVKKPVSELKPLQRFIVYHEYSHGSLDGGRLWIWPIVHVSSAIGSVLLAAALVGLSWTGAVCAATVLATALFLGSSKIRRTKEAEAYADTYAAWVIWKQNPHEAVGVLARSIEDLSGRTSFPTREEKLTAAHRLASLRREREAMLAGETWDDRHKIWVRQIYAWRWYVYLNCALIALWCIPPFWANDFSLLHANAIGGAAFLAALALWYPLTYQGREFGRWMKYHLEVADMIDDRQILAMLEDVAPNSVEIVGEEETDLIISGTHSLEPDFARRLVPGDPGGANFPNFGHVQDLVTYCATAYSIYEITGKTGDFLDFFLDHDRKLKVVQRVIEKLRVLGLKRPADEIQVMLDRVLDYLTRPRAAPPPT
ncbi:hypothetical protein [Bradyrhizobium sp. CCBAU 53338]|uniref:hypothetical protein n=1 Tax=Bradyrhizobium sp. CCBAU 53338 TaxID=1325111 RepID=UPI00188A73EE|nr:hypothetical protein [Bradyrhizobium sp. CCBAU 53338]QOZ51557.1 hypothetical protein XH90_09310 [Bradyrhizobium sp. CCBAU 53338]